MRERVRGGDGRQAGVHGRAGLADGAGGAGTNRVKRSEYLRTLRDRRMNQTQVRSRPRRVPGLGPVRPAHRHVLCLVGAQTEEESRRRLREIARAGVDLRRLTLAVGSFQGDACPNGSGVARRTLQAHGQGGVAGDSVVAEGDKGTVVLGHDDVGPAVAVEVAAGQASVADMAAAYSHRLLQADSLPRLYRGDGEGGFVHEPANLRRTSAPMGCNYGDLDGDGFLDFYLGTGWPEYEALMPNLVFRNRAGADFADVTTSAGLGHLQKGHAVVFADFDNDGDQDVFEQMGGFYRGDGYFDTFYENPGFGNRYLTVILEGTRSNRSAIGARLHLVVREGEASRSIYRHVNSGATFGGNPLRRYFGLGKADAIERLEILWPTTGETQTLTGLPMDRILRVIEGREGYQLIELKRVVLGG